MQGLIVNAMFGWTCKPIDVVLQLFNILSQNDLQFSLLEEIVFEINKF